jgi:hypothetical protein
MWDRRQIGLRLKESRKWLAKAIGLAYIEGASWASTEQLCCVLHQYMQCDWRGGLLMNAEGRSFNSGVSQSTALISKRGDPLDEGSPYAESITRMNTT